MILEIPDLLTPEELKYLQNVGTNASFSDGRLTNPHNKTKNNQQIDYSSSDYQKSSQLIMAALYRNQNFQNFAMPNRMAPPLVCKYEIGMAYGIHNDQAHLQMDKQLPLRSDISITVFLASKSSYDGGELVIHLESESVKVKLEAGSAVIYPSTHLHEVAKVTRGERLVSITFVESRVSEERKRHMIYTLGEVSALEGLTMKHENRIKLEVVKQNLIRLWS